jgi:outer membrane immunogenic protein
MGIKRQLLISTAIGVASMPQVGHAADLAVKAPPAPLPQATSWTGFYIGGHAGYSWGSLNGDTNETVVVPPRPFVGPGTELFSLDRDIDPQGALGGVQAGYNLQSGALVYGIEADITWTDQHDSFNFTGSKFTVTEDFNYQETTAARLKYLGTVRARFGYASGNLLWYVTGGFAYGDLKMNFSSNLTQAFCPPCVATFSGAESQFLLGGAVGAGLEHAFAEHWSLRAEYLYVDLGRKTFFAGVPGGGSFGVTDSIFRVGLNFRP